MEPLSFVVQRRRDSLPDIWLSCKTPASGYILAIRFSRRCGTLTRALQRDYPPGGLFEEEGSDLPLFPRPASLLAGRWQRKARRCSERRQHWCHLGGGLDLNLTRRRQRRVRPNAHGFLPGSLFTSCGEFTRGKAAPKRQSKCGRSPHRGSASRRKGEPGWACRRGEGGDLASPV